MTQLAECDAVVHLAGEPIAGKRWSAEYLARMKASRVDSTKLEAIAAKRGEASMLVDQTGFDR